MQRVKAKEAGSILIGNDATHLLDFMSDNWAYVLGDTPVLTDIGRDAQTLPKVGEA
jgi:hypothetical protein